MTTLNNMTVATAMIVDPVKLRAIVLFNKLIKDKAYTDGFTNNQFWDICKRDGLTHSQARLYGKQMFWLFSKKGYIRKTGLTVNSTRSMRQLNVWVAVPEMADKELTLGDFATVKDNSIR